MSIYATIWLVASGWNIRKEFKMMNTDQEVLTSYIQRIERLEEEKAELLSDIREVYAEAKGAGFDTKCIREMIKLRKKAPHDRAEEEFLREKYKELLGMED